MSQTTSTVFMVKPSCFGFNEETAANNAFQKEGFEKGAQEKALNESTNFIKLLQENGINVIFCTRYIRTKNTRFSFSK